MPLTVKEAILSTQMDQVVKRLDKIDSKLDDQSNNYVSRSEFEAFKKAVKVNYVLVALISAIITALIYGYFQVGHP